MSALGTKLNKSNGEPILLEEAQKLLMEIVTPYDAILPEAENMFERYLLHIFRIGVAFSRKEISSEVVHKAQKMLQIFPAYKIAPMNITSDYYGDDLGPLMENLDLLSRLRAREVALDVFTALFHKTVDLPKIPQRSDYLVASHLSRYPLDSAAQIARSCGVHPNTARSSLKRLFYENHMRIHCFIDWSAFGLEDYTFVFSIKSDVDKDVLEKGLAEFPFTKKIFLSNVENLHYASFLLPSDKKLTSIFELNLEKIIPETFDYANLHTTKAFGMNLNLNNLVDSKWVISSDVPTHFESSSSMQNVVNFKGDIFPGLTFVDYAIASVFDIGLGREPPKEFSDRLKHMDIEINPRAIAYRKQKLLDNGLVVPFLHLQHIDLRMILSAELICDESAKTRIVSLMRNVPHCYFMSSSRGGILWIYTPHYLLIEIYKIVSSLRCVKGIDSLRFISTSGRQGGSRSGWGFRDYCKFEEGYPQIEPIDVDLTEYIG